jgi:acyl-[acyl carrier protein]--UDP-N-acetylglucosamine O-acyltransferase
MRTFAKQKFHIMADQHIDIERMIMQAQYKMLLESEASSVKGGQLSDMEREQYQNQIKDLLQAVETLLKSNKAMGERVAQLEKIAEDYEELKAAIKRKESQTCSNYPEREQARRSQG